MLAHLTLPTQDVQSTTRFLARSLGYKELPVPDNAQVETRWFDIGNGQQLHVFFVKDFRVSPFEAEFGRHIALFRPLEDFDMLKANLVEAGGELIAPLRPTPFQRFFFRDPVNGYLFEIIDDAVRKTSSD